MTSLLAKEILQNEEMLLKETKVKLLEQLNRLKVEEVALQRYLLDITENPQPQEHNAHILEDNRYETVTTSSNSEVTSYTDDASALNQMPLENLKPNDTEQMDQEVEEEEDEDDQHT